MLSTAEAARELGCAPGYVRVLCEHGLIQGAQKMGRDWIIPAPVVRLPGSVRELREKATT